MKKLLLISVALTLATTIIIAGSMTFLARYNTSGDANNMLNYGVKYVTEDELSWILLYDNNEFIFNRSIATSYRPTGSYSINNGMLILHVADSEEYVFDINNGELIFRSGVYAEEFVKPKTVFKVSKDNK